MRLLAEIDFGLSADAGTLRCAALHLSDMRHPDQHQQNAEVGCPADPVWEMARRFFGSCRASGVEPTMRSKETLNQLLHSAPLRDALASIPAATTSRRHDVMDLAVVLLHRVGSGYLAHSEAALNHRQLIH